MSQPKSELLDVVEEVQRIDTDVKRLQRSIRAYEELADGKSRNVLQLAWRYALLVYESKDVFSCKILSSEWNNVRSLLQRPNRVSCSSECRKLILMLREAPKLLAQVLLRVESNKQSNSLIRDSLVSVCGGVLFADDQKVALQLLRELLLNRINECDKAEEVFESHTSVFHKTYMEYLNLSVSIHSFIIGVLYNPLIDLVTECTDYLDYDTSKVIARLNEKVSSPGGNQIMPLNKEEENIRQKVDDSRHKLIHYCNKILSNLEKNLTAMPPGLVWLLTAAKHAILRKWAQVDETALCKSLLDFLFGTILCPAMINPDHRGLLDSCLLNRPVRHNINQIALLLQALPRLSFDELEKQVDSFHAMMASFDMTRFHHLSKKLSQLLSLNSFPCTVLLPIAKRPFLYITKQQLDNIISAIMWIKDNSSNDAQFSELIQSAIHCSEESVVTSSVSTTPEATPTTTPSSTPPARRKRWQRQSGGTKSPSREKSSTVTLPVGGGASGTAATTKNKLLFVAEEKISDQQQLQVICVPLTTNWNIEVVYMAEQESEAEFIKNLEGKMSNGENKQPLLLDLTTSDGVNEDGVNEDGVGLKSNVEIVTTNGSDENLLNDDATMLDTLLHVRNCLYRALEGISLDNISQIYAVVNNPAVNNLISLDQSSQSCLRDELIAILHQQASWYHCSGQDGEMLLLQDLLQKLDQIPAKKISHLITMVTEECRRREKYVNYLRKVDQELCRHGSQMDSTLKLFNRLLELLMTIVATFTVKHFLLEQESTMKHFTSQVKQGNLMIDDKCALVHKCLQHLQQKLMAQPSWGSTTNEDCDNHMILEAFQFVQHMCYSNIYRDVFYPNGVSDQYRDRIFQQHMADLSSNWDLKQITKVYHVTSPWTSAQQHLKIMRNYMTPHGKVMCVLRCCNTIIHLLRCCHNGHPPGADEVFPVLLYVLVKANPISLLSTIQFVETFKLDELEGETAYWWHQFTSAVQYIKTLTPDK